MTYDLAVWEGERPKSNEAALSEFERLMDAFHSDDEGEVEVETSPTAAIARYVDALLARWPDLGDEGDEDSPWGDGPLINNASGPIIYFSIVWSRAGDASAYASDLAALHGLVCFDPQAEALRS